MHPIKRARLDRRWSQSRLIAQLEIQAAALGERLPSRPSLKTQVSRWENGHRTPDRMYRQLLECVFGATAVELGFEPADDTGLTLGADWGECVATTTDLWGADIDRRAFLGSAAFAVGAFATPTLRALVADNAALPTRVDGSCTVSVSDVSLIRDMTRSFRVMDNRHGGGRVRRAALTWLNTDVAPLLRHGRFSAEVGPALLAAVAELTHLVGWMAHDVGRHGLAQRYLIQALGLAREANDSALMAELLAAMSQQSTYLGHGAPAVDLARAARTLAGRCGNSALLAESAVMEAHGHASQGAGPACARSIHQAELALDKADRSADPDWIGYFDQAYLSAKFGHCFRELGDTANAIRFAQRSLDMDNSYARGRAFNLSLLAHAHASAGHIGEACSIGQEAVQLTSGLRSARAIGYLRGLRSALAPAAATPEVRHLDSVLQPLLMAA